MLVHLVACVSKPACQGAVHITYMFNPTHAHEHAEAHVHKVMWVTPAPAACIRMHIKSNLTASGVKQDEQVW